MAEGVGTLGMKWIGRFAPSPTGTLHLGNLRTALAARSFAADGFIIRMEDLDRVTSSRELAREQLTDLKELGIESDVVIEFQSERFGIYESYLNQLSSRGLTYECFCTRKEIREAAAAPHGDFVLYPGTCRDLDEDDRAERRLTRQPA